MLLYRKHIYWIVGVTAAAVRLAAFLAWRQSPLSCFHLIPGLDMMTHWELGRRLAAGLGIFTPYRFLIAAAGTPPLLTGCQMLGGILTALLATRCAFRLWGNRGTALAAGLLTALYAPALLYECVALQESLLALLGIAAFDGFTVLVADLSEHVGCAVQQFPVVHRLAVTVFEGQSRISKQSAPEHNAFQFWKTDVELVYVFKCAKVAVVDKRQAAFVVELLEHIQIDGTFILLFSDARVQRDVLQGRVVQNG